MLKTKNLREFCFLTIRQIRTKAGVETRIEHANARFSRSSGDHHARSTSGSRPRLHDDFDVASQQHQEPNQTIQREASQPAASQRRDFRLVDFEELRRGRLG